MEKIKIKIKGKEIEIEKGKRFIDICDDKNVIAVEFNGKIYDLQREIEEEGEIRWLTFDDEESKKVYWHSTAHIMAQAVKELFPDAKLGVGPPIENGFYYDFEIKPLTPEDLQKIEEKMKEIIKKDLKFERIKISREEAKKLFEKLGEKFKLELLEEIEEPITIYKQGDFVDLCTGPHVPSTSYIKAFKLLTVSAAYWRGDEKRESLQRIYGISFDSEEKLNEWLKYYEEAKKYDHRRVGKEQDLFSIQEECGPGLVLWHPKGGIIRKIIEDFWKEEHLKRGYQIVYTPHVAKAELWKISGHLDYYKEFMCLCKFGDEEYVLKPMNCPFHILIYKSQVRSYRDLPIRYAELGTVYRYERSGVLHGLLRVRGFTQDDAHIFCRPDQVEDEILNLLDLVEYMTGVFGLKEFKVELSVRDPHHKEKYAGNDEEWELAEDSLSKALDKKGWKYKRAEGEAVFYGPKIDVKFKDAIGRVWQGPTIQFDFNLPKRFNVTFIDKDGKEKNVVMIHRAILGSLERFLGTLLEYHRGALPVWLSPIQVWICSVVTDVNDYCEKIKAKLEKEGIRCYFDDSADRITAKIKRASLQRPPYILIVGKKEVEENTVSVRKRGKGEIGKFLLDEFINLIKKEISERVV